MIILLIIYVLYIVGVTGLFIYSYYNWNKLTDKQKFNKIARMRASVGV